MFSPDELLIALRRRCLAPDVAALCVAFSGGLDSTVLLHALAQARAQAGFALRALHVNHGLHPDAAMWAGHCQRTAEALNVDCRQLTVEVRDVAELGLEAGARKARYAALEAALQPDEYLLTAHHADDQLETILLALMRGAGVEGLAAMPPVRRFGPGWLARPLLGFDRLTLAQWASAQGLVWLDDPSNADASLDRNFLRQRVTPALRERWPVAATTAARSADHLQAAAASQQALAQIDAVGAVHGACLSVAALRQLTPSRRDNLLRHWLRQSGAQMPSTRKLAAIVQDMLGAADERLPCVQWGVWEVRRHRDLLYCMHGMAPPLSALEWQLPAPPDGSEWQLPAPLPLSGGVDELRMTAAAAGVRGLDPARLGTTLRVIFRQPHQPLPRGVDLSVAHLKKILQSRGVLPWWRGHVPLLVYGDRVVAVGDLWVASDFLTAPGQAGWRLQWQGRARALAADMTS